MKQTSIVSLFVLCMSLIYSCSKDEEPASPMRTFPKFSQLKAGNYWVYEQFDIDTLGNATPTNTFDSCYIEKDTIINNITYYKMVRPRPYASNQFNISYQRDSLHYVVDVDGNILFSSEDFSTVFGSRYNLSLSGNDTISFVRTKMTDKDVIVSSPAGTFTTSNLQHEFTMHPNFSFAGNKRTMNTRYAENVGIVIETLPFFQTAPDLPGYIERRLVRYNVGD